MYVFAFFDIVFAKSGRTMWIANTEELPCNPQRLVAATIEKTLRRLERLALAQASGLTRLSGSSNQGRVFS